MTHAAVQPSPQPGSLASRLGPAKAVVVVEDDNDIARFMRAYLRASGFAVTCVAPREVADVLQVVQAETPVCVLLDHNLGHGMLSGDVLTALRGLATPPPVIIVSGDASLKRHELLAAGAAEFVPKPFSAKRLAALIIAVADREPIPVG